MDQFDIPILQKAYDLYRLLHQYRTAVPKQDRYTLWQRVETVALDSIENIFMVSEVRQEQKLLVLKRISAKLNLLRLLLRLARDTKSIDLRKAVKLQEVVDEIGRMLGGWIKASA